MKKIDDLIEFLRKCLNEQERTWIKESSSSAQGNFSGGMYHAFEVVLEKAKQLKVNMGK